MNVYTRLHHRQGCARQITHTRLNGHRLQAARVHQFLHRNEVHIRRTSAQGAIRLHHADQFKSVFQSLNGLQFAGGMRVSQPDLADA